MHAWVMRKGIVALTVGLVVASAALAQAPQRLLNDGDVKKFVRDFKPMTAELDKLGKAADVDTENMSGLNEVLNKLRANAEAQRILRKYGWADRQFDKFAAIFRGYAVVKLEGSETVDSGEVKEAIAMIESNPSLSAEQKAAMKAQMSQMQGMAGTEKELRAQVHPADIAVIKANEAALDEAFDE